MRRITALIVLAFYANAFESLNEQRPKNYWNDLIPIGKEIDYNYEATLNAGISLPDDYSSMFHLRGVLHVQISDENELLLKLTNLNYTMDNGKVSEFPEKVPMQLGDHMSLLSSHFKLVMDEYGDFQEIIFEETTPEFIRNIQKGLAQMFIIRWHGMSMKSTKFQTIREANTIWNYIPNDNMLKIEMLGTLYGSHDESLHNVDSFTCDESFEEPLSRDLQRVYTLNKSKNLMEKIVQTGGVYYHPFKGVPPPYSIYVTQTLEMIHMHDIETPWTFKKEDKVDSLSMNFNDPNLPVNNITNKETLIPIAVNLIQEVIQFIETRKIDLSMPDFEKHHIPSRLRIILQHFDMNMLENLLKLLIEKGQKETDVFYQVIAQVGTHDSIKLLISLIKTKKLNEFQAIRALQKMPFYTVINEEIFNDLHVLLDLGVSWEIQNVANLCYGSFMHRAQKSHYISSTTEKKVIKTIIKKLKATNIIEEKYSYFNTLHNLGSWMTHDYLLQFLNDKELRMKALTTLHRTIADRYDGSALQILMDRSLPTDYRIMAFYTFMQSQPRLSELINIYWMMLTETDIDLYQFYYTYMQSMANIKNPCRKAMKLKAIQLMKYMHSPYRHSLTGYKLVEQYKPEINRGEYLDWFIIDSNDSLLLHLGYGKTIMNMHMRPISFYMRLSGLQGKLLNDLKLNIQKGMKLFNYNEVLKNIMKILDNEHVLLDIGYAENGQILLSDTLHKSNYLDKLKFYMKYSKFEDETAIDINFDFVYRLNVQNNIGFHISQNIQRVILERRLFDMHFDYKDNIITLNFNGKLDWSEYYDNGLYTHNPISQTWQGVGKTTIYDNVIPITLDINLNLQQDLLKISWRGQKNEEDNVIAARSYVAHHVLNYNHLNSNTLKKFNPNALGHVILPTNLDVRNTHTIIESDDQNTGFKSSVTIFDTEDSKSVDEISPLKTEGLDVCSHLELMLKHLQFDDNLVSNMLKYSTMDNELEMMYKHGRRGVLMLMQPSKINPITNMEVTLRLDHQITKETHSLILPEMNIIVKGSFSLKNKEELMKRWDASINWELNSGHTVNSVKAQLTRIKPGETDYKICLEGIEVYKGINANLEFTGNLDIKMGETTDGTCKDDGGKIDIIMKGERLPEQLKGNFNFPSCHRQVFLEIPSRMPSYSCLADKLTIRKYEFEIKSKNVPDRLQRFSQRMLEFLKVNYYDHYSIDKSNEPTNENIKIVMTYPVPNDVLDMEMVKGDHRYKLTALPAVNFRRYGFFIPDNLLYSNIQKMMHVTGMTHICSANHLDVINVNNTLMSNVIMDDWVVAIQDVIVKPLESEFKILLKKLDNKLALKIVLRDITLTVLPVGNKYEIKISNNAQIGGVTQVPSDLLVFNNDLVTLLNKDNMLTIFIKERGTHLVYNVNEVMMEVPRLNKFMEGICL
nr:uncharacterized protein LOC111417492 [Onthophagus taurus]